MHARAIKTVENVVLAVILFTKVVNNSPHTHRGEFNSSTTDIYNTPHHP